MKTRRKNMWKILFNFVNENGSELNSEIIRFVEDILCKDPSLISSRIGRKLEYYDTFLCWFINNTLLPNLANNEDNSLTDGNLQLQKGILLSCLINRPALFSHLTLCYADTINQIAEFLSNLQYANINENIEALQICFGKNENNSELEPRFEELHFNTVKLSLKASEKLMFFLLKILNYAHSTGFDVYFLLFARCFAAVLNALRECGFKNKLECLKFCNTYLEKLDYIDNVVEHIIVDVLSSLSSMWEMVPLWLTARCVSVEDVCALAQLTNSIAKNALNLIKKQMFAFLTLSVTNLSENILQTLLSVVGVIRICKNSEHLSNLLNTYVTLMFHFQISYGELFFVDVENCKLIQNIAFAHPVVLRLIAATLIQKYVTTDVDIKAMNFKYLQDQFFKHIKLRNSSFEELNFFREILSSFLFLQNNFQLIEKTNIASKFLSIYYDDASLLSHYVDDTFKVQLSFAESALIALRVDLSTFFLKLNFIRNVLSTADVKRLIEYIESPLKYYVLSCGKNKPCNVLDYNLLEVSMKYLCKLKKKELGSHVENVRHFINQCVKCLFLTETIKNMENLKNIKLIICQQTANMISEGLCSKDVLILVLSNNLNTNLFPLLLKSIGCGKFKEEENSKPCVYNAEQPFDNELNYFECCYEMKVFTTPCIETTFDITTLPTVAKQFIYRSLLVDERVALFSIYLEHSDLTYKEFLQNFHMILEAPFINSSSIQLLVKKYMSEENFLLELLRQLLNLILKAFQLKQPNVKRSQLNILRIIHCCSFLCDINNELIFYFFKMSIFFVLHPQSFVAYEAITIITEMCQTQRLQPLQLWNWYKQESLDVVIKLAMFSYIQKGIRLINSLENFTKILGFSCVQELICRYYRLFISLLVPYCVKENKIKGLIIGISKTTRKPISGLLKNSFLRIYTQVFTNDKTEGKACVDMIIKITSSKLNELLNADIKQTVSEFLIHFQRHPDFVKKTFQNVYCKELRTLEKTSSNSFASFIADRFLGIIIYFESCLFDKNIEKPIKEAVLCSFSEIMRVVGPEHVTKYRFKIIAMLEFVASLHDSRLQMICLKIWNIFLHVVNIKDLGPSLGHIVATLQQLLPSSELEVNNIYKFLILENSKLFDKYLSELYFLQVAENVTPRIRETIRVRVDRDLKNKTNILEKLSFFCAQISSTNVRIRINGLKFLQEFILNHRVEINQLMLYVITVDAVLEKITDQLILCCRHEDFKLQLAAAKCLGELGAVDPSYLPSTFSYEQSSAITLGVHTDDFTVMALNELCRAYQFQKGTKYVDNISLAIQETLSSSGISPSENKKLNVWESMPLNMRQIMTPFLTSCYTVSRRDYGCPYYPIFNSSNCRNYTEWSFSWATRLIDYVQAKDTKHLFNSYKPSMRRNNEILTKFFPYILIHALQDCTDAELKTVFEEFHIVFMSCQQANISQPNCDASVLKEFHMTNCVENISTTDINKKKDFATLENVVNKCAKLCSELLDFLRRWLYEWERTHNVTSSKESAGIFDRVQKFLKKFNKFVVAKANFNANEFARSLIYLEEYILEDSANRLQEQLSFLMQIYYKLEEIDSVEGAINYKTSNLTLSEQILLNRMIDRPYEAMNCYEQLMSLDLEQVGQDDIKGMINCYLNMETPETALLIADGLWQKFSEQYTDEYFKECKLELFWRLGRYKESKDLLEDNLIRCNATNWNAQCARIFLLFRQPINFSEEKSRSSIKYWIAEIDKVREHVLSNLRNSYTSQHFFSYSFSYDETVKLHLITEAEKAKLFIYKLFEGANSNAVYVEECLSEMKKFILDWELRLTIVQPVPCVIEPILAFRRNLLSEANKFIMLTYLLPNSNNALSDVNNLINAEIGNLWIRSAQMYRDAGNLQQAHISLMRCEQYAPKVLFLEKAKLLWKMGDQRTSFKVIEENLERMFVKCNRNLKSLNDDERTLYAEAKFLQAKYSAESMNVCADLNLRYFKDAITLNKNSEKCQVYLAQYMEKIYNSYSEEQKHGDNGRKVMLEIMLSYAKSLRCGVQNVYQSLPRLLTLWLDYTSEYNTVTSANEARSSGSTQNNSNTTQVRTTEELARKMNDLMSNCSNVLSTSIFYTSFSQMLSRICHPSEDVFSILRAIIIKITKTYPHQSLWKLLPIFKSFNNNRVKRCKLILTDSRLGDATFQKLLVDFNMLTERLIELTNKEMPPDNNYELNSLVKQLPRLFENPNFSQILLPFEKFMQISFPIAPTLCSDEFSLNVATNQQNSTPSLPSNPFPHKQVFICGISNEIIVLRSAAKPKKITIRCDDGQEYAVMVKPKDDLRRDFRLMEFNDLVKRYLHLDFMARNRRLRIRTYAVVPFNEECGLVEWLPNLNSFRNICTTIYRRRNLGMSDQVLRKYVVPKTDNIENKRKVFIEQLLPSHPAVFHEWFHQRFPTPHMWYEARTSYVKTVAVMSIVGYILGLGDRHGENILFDETNGDVVHVDFNCLFNQGEFFAYPELVPFRLTQNMTFAMGPLKVEGLYRKTCEITLRVLKHASTTLMSVLRPFVYDLCVYNRNIGKQQRGMELTDPKAMMDVQRIDERLQGFILNLNCNGDTSNISTSHSGLANDLRNWVNTENVSMIAVDSLLRLLKRNGHDSELPSDHRTLLKTPRNTVREGIESTNGGLYAHFGVEISLIRVLPQICNTCPTTIDIFINCDGISLFSSSKHEMWPILLSIEANGKRSNPFIVGAHYGKTKPSNANEYLSKVVAELKIIKENGIKFMDNECRLGRIAVVCDSPARSYITYTKSHSGYFSCSKCVQEGEYVDHVILPETDSALRTDESFRLKIHSEHHTGVSILEELGIRMVSHVPLDYMHLVCLGVVKRIISDLLKGPKSIRLNNESQKSIENNIFKFTTCYPWEFSRKLRPLNEFAKFKATEFRLFLLYVGPVLLKKYVSEQYYKHFLALSVGVRILCDPDLCTSMNEFANSLLISFVQQYENFHGPGRLTYNVHNLIHLANEVKTFGNLDCFSSFPFENCLRMLKKKIKAAPKPLHQLMNRVAEENKCLPKSKILKIYPAIHFLKSPKIELNGFSFSEKAPNNCIESVENSIILVSSVYETKDGIFLDGKMIIEKQPLFTEPCDSEMLSISVCKMSSAIDVKKIPVTMVSRKCLMLPHETDDFFVSIGLIHH